MRCKDFERFRKEDKHGMGRCKRVGRDPVGGNDCGRSNDSVPVSSDSATGIKKSTRISRQASGAQENKPIKLQWKMKGKSNGDDKNYDRQQDFYN